MKCVDFIILKLLPPKDRTSVDFITITNLLRQRAVAGLVVSFDLSQEPLDRGDHQSDSSELSHVRFDVSRGVAWKHPVQED